MRILLEVKQTDLVLKTFLQPLCNLSFVKEIHVVRDVAGPKMPKVTYYPTGGSGSFARAFNKLRKVFQLTKKLSPDVIMACDVYPHFFNCFLAAKIYKKPLLLSLRGELVNNPLRPDNPFMNNLIIWMIKKTDVVATTGNKLREYLLKKGVSPKKTYFIPVSIDISKFKKKSIKKKYDLMTIARFSPEKRLDRFLKVVQGLKKEKKDISALIVGSGPEMKYLKNLSKELGVEKNVELPGHCSKTSNLLNQSKCFLVTSETEGLPQTIVESMSCGIPVITPSIGDIPDIVNNKNGILIHDKTSVAEYEKAVKRLLGNRLLREKLSKEAVKIKKQFSFKEAEKIYKRILSPWNSQ